MKYIILASLVLAACSFKKGQLENQTLKGHEELYSEPDAPTAEKKGYSRVVIAATNDLHGEYRPQLLKFKDDHNPTELTMEVGGVDIISSYFKILREQFKEIILVDSGDVLPKRASQVDYVESFYDTFGYDAITVGLSDLNLKIPSKFATGPDFLKDFAKSTKTPVILGNLYEVKTGRVVEWPGSLPYLIHEVNGVKVGVIGVLPDDIVTETPTDSRLGLFLESMLQSTLGNARLLRSLGAEIIVVISHQGIKCGEKLAQEQKLPLSKVNFEPLKKDMCDLSNKMGEYLNRLPPNLVDVFVGGRHHQKMANVINGTLVMSGFPDGKSFSYVEFFVDQKTGKVNKSLTEYHQPVMFCREFFKETNDCYSEDSSVDHKERTPAEFLGKKVEPDLSLEKKFQPFMKEAPQTTEAPLPELLKAHGAQLALRRQSSGNAKLVRLEVSGKKLMSILEAEYNAGREADWTPSPFKRQADELNLTVGGAPVSPGANYFILSDLEELQAHPRLRRLIAGPGVKTFASSSWDMELQSDGVSTAMAAIESDTVR